MTSILIVDDEPEILRTQKLGLQNNGYRVVTAGDADTALLRLSEPHSPVDMVLTDHAMPGMTGLDLVKLLRGNGIFIPVILMTALGEKSLVIQALQHQCNGFIEKPFTMDDLLKEIRRARQALSQNRQDTAFKHAVPRLLHQINNPLAAISGHAETGLFDPDLPGNLKMKFECIVKAVDKIKTLNRDILKMGARGPGRPASDPGIRVKPVDVLQDTLHQFKGVFDREGINVHMRWKGKPVMVPVSENDLGHVFDNLIQNAVDAVAGSDTRKIRITGVPDHSRTAVRIRVADSGQGIHESDRPGIFEPYVTRKKNGTGLGLAIVKEIIESHGGTITVNSRAGRGTCFKIDLPAAMTQQKSPIELGTKYEQ